MRGTTEVARKFGTGFPLVLAWALGMTSCTGAPLPSKQEISTPVAAVTLVLTVPEGGWHLRIERIFARGDELWILAQLQHQSGPSSQIIQTVQATLPSGLPAKPQRVFIAGKTWKWANQEPYEFVSTLSDVIKQAGAARMLYPVKTD